MILAMLRTLFNCMAILCLLVILVMLGSMLLPSIGKSLAEKDKRDNDKRHQQMIEDMYGPTKVQNGK